MFIGLQMTSPLLNDVKFFSKFTNVSSIFSCTVLMLFTIIIGFFGMFSWFLYLQLHFMRENMLAWNEAFVLNLVYNFCHKFLYKFRIVYINVSFLKYCIQFVLSYFTENVLGGCPDLEPEPAGLKSYIPLEQPDRMIDLNILKYDQQKVTAYASWDSSMHDSAYLNRATQNNERIYLVLKVIFLSFLQDSSVVINI